MDDDGHYMQTDPRWAGELWYDARLEDLLVSLTRRLNRHARRKTRSPKAALHALKTFNRAVRRFLSRPQSSQPRCSGSLHEVGCFLVCQANVLRCFGVRIGGRKETPLVLLDALQDKLLLTVTGYTIAPGIDHLHVATRGHVALSAFEGHGRSGVRPVESDILRSRLNRNHIAVVNVGSSEFEGASDHSHYVAVVRRVGRNFEMLDPEWEWPSGRWLLPHYKKLYGVWLYQNRSKRRRGRR